MSLQTRTFGKPTTLNDIIETTITELAKHQLLNGGANITGPDGRVVKPVKFRNFSGVEVKEQGLTVSVYPYYYEGTSRPTPESKNASVSLVPYGFIGPDPKNPTGAVDLATANIKIRLDMLGYTLQTKPQQNTSLGQRGLFGTNLGVQTFEANYAEEILRDYAEYVRLALSNELFNLNGLVRGSQVTWINHISTTWDTGGNLILHTAEIMWQVYYNPLRSWKSPGIIRGKDILIGSLDENGHPVFYRPSVQAILTGFGQVFLTTPTGQRISWRSWNTVEGDGISTLYNPENNQPLSAEALYRPGTTRKFINLDLLPIGVLTIGDIPLYFRKSTSQLLTYDGNLFTQIPGPNAKLSDGALDLTDKSTWIPVSWNLENFHLIYGAGHEKVGQRVTPSDMINPETGDLYLITGQVYGLNFETRVPVREFLLFDSPNPRPQ